MRTLNDHPQVSVLIPCKSSELGFPRCLNSVLSQKGVDFEVLVCFNPNPAFQHLVAKNNPRVRFLWSPVPNANAARNLCLSNSRGRIVYFLDADCELPDELFLSRLLKSFDQSSTVVCVGGGYVLKPSSSAIASAYHFLQNHWLMHFPRQCIPPMPVLFGGNMAFVREFLVQFKFDDQLAYGSCETELFMQMQLRLDQVRVDETLSVIHNCQINLLSLLSKARKQSLGMRYILKKHQGKVQYKGKKVIVPKQPFQDKSIRLCAWLYSFFFEYPSWRDSRKFLVSLGKQLLRFLAWHSLIQLKTYILQMFEISINTLSMADSNGKFLLEQGQQRQLNLNELQVTFVLPCLNEEAALKQPLAEIKSILPSLGIHSEIIVVDNGSEDRSAEVALQLGARVIKESQRGYGRSLKTGIMAAQNNVIVYADADSTYNLSESIELLRALETHKADLVIGNRLHSKLSSDSMPRLHRYFGTPILSWLLYIFSPKGSGPIKDCNSGFRAFRKDCYVAWQVKSNGMEFASELLLAAAYSTAKIQWVDCELRPSPKNRQSKLRPWKDGFRHLKSIVFYRLRSAWSDPETSFFASQRKQ